MNNKEKIIITIQKVNKNISELKFTLANFS